MGKQMKQRLLLICAMGALAGSVSAEEAPVPEEVREQYEAGKAHFEAGDYEAAMAAFTAAYNLTGEPNLLFNLAASAERLGDAERAIAFYLVYLEEVPEAADAESVRERIALLKTDGIPEPEPTPEPEPEPEPEPAVEPAPDLDPKEYYKKRDEDARSPIWPALTIGLGGFVVASGITTAILATKKFDSLESTCKPDCTDDDIRSAKALAIATDVQLVLGGAALVAGVVGIVLEKRAARNRERAVRLSPIPTAGGGALSIEGRF